MSYPTQRIYAYMNIHLQYNFFHIFHMNILIISVAESSCMTSCAVLCTMSFAAGRVVLYVGRQDVPLCGAFVPRSSECCRQNVVRMTT